MTDKKMIPASDDQGKPFVWVSFCPDFGIYHLHREVEGEDPADLRLSRVELLDMVEGLLRVNKAEEAGQLTTFCAWARLFAHKVVEFTTSGVFRVYRPTQPDDSEREEAADMQKFFAEWRAAHPNDDELPVLPERK